MLLSQIKQEIKEREDDIADSEQRLDKKINKRARNRHLRMIEQWKNDITELSNVQAEINILMQSSQVYHIAHDDSKKPICITEDSHWGILEYDLTNNWAVIYLSVGASTGLTAHEVKHAFQFENGLLDLGTAKLLYDQADEIEAYSVGSLFGEIKRDAEWIKYKYSKLPPEARDVQLWNTSPSTFPDSVLQNNAKYGWITRYKGKTYVKKKKQ